CAIDNLDGSSYGDRFDVW
nr:immunoglobulin heavy chain junction region [Macaca mulatta]MOW84070.1 immunoglobulin heavy chain junction region [Macaca mulatta]MOW84138.1 immunoglobulin heavy chain junction region [Macaca mulatta]